MYWEEKKARADFSVPDDVVDLAFKISCHSLPVDHAYDLAKAITKVLPWLPGEKGAGIHSIHGAESGNGWMRPENPEDLIYLSRRTRLVLRLHKHRVEDAKALIGQTLVVADNRLWVDEASVHPLSSITTIFSRYVVATDDDDEGEFLFEAAQRLRDMGGRPRKMLCGIERSITRPNERIRTRSLMLADLSLEDSVLLQRSGLGPERHLGCGLFLPHKDIDQVRGTANEGGDAG